MSSHLNDSNQHNTSRRFAGRHRQEQNASLGNVLRHYDDEERLYNITIPRQQFQLGGYQLKDPTVPRGKHGIDTMERDMREMRQVINEERIREEQNRRLERAFEQRSALETQLAEKTAILEQTRNAELQEDQEILDRNRPYGPYHDERRELEWKRYQQSRQKQALEKQISDKAIRDAEEAQHFAAAPPDWEEGLKELDSRIHKAIHGDPDEYKRRQAEQNQSQQPKVIQDARDSSTVKKEEAEKPLSMGVAMFADRILLAEKARRDGREKYKAELDAQMREKAARRQNELANNIIIDRSYHFGALQRAAPVTPPASEVGGGERQAQQQADPAGMNNSRDQQQQQPHFSAASSRQANSAARRFW